MKVGYVRVSTEEQNEQRQVEALEKFGVEKTYIDKASGKNTDRPQFKAMMDFVREGDIVYVLDFSRMSRSLPDLLSVMEKLKEKKVALKSLKENFDTGTPTGKLMLQVVAAINEFERENIKERQMEGIRIAQREGRYQGRKRIELEGFEEIYSLWKEGDVTAASASRHLGISRGTFYNRVKEYETMNEREEDTSGESGLSAERT